MNELKCYLKYYLYSMIAVVLCYLVGMSGLHWDFSKPPIYHVANIGVGAISILILVGLSLLIWWILEIIGSHKIVKK